MSSVRSYWFLWTAHFISSTGKWIYYTVLSYAFYKTYNNSSLGLWISTYTLPILLFAPFAGICADRYDKKAIFLVCYSVLATLPLILTLQFSRPIVYSIGFIESIASTFLYVGLRSYIKEISLQYSSLVNYHSWLIVSQLLPNMIGAGIGGLLINYPKFSHVILLNAGLGLLAFFLILVGCQKTLKNFRQSRILSEMKEGLFFIQNSPRLKLSVFLLSYLTLFYTFFTAFFVSWSDGVFPKNALFYALDGSWIDNLDIPFSGIKSYIRSLQKGDSLKRDINAEVQEGKELADKYKALLMNTFQRQEFTRLLNLAKTVAVYLEEHNFYIENWLHTIFWQKTASLGAMVCKANFTKSPTDIYYLNRWELGELLYELSATWASGAPARGCRSYPSLISKRRDMFKILKQTPPVAAIGKAPACITEPLTITLFGITDEMIKSWENLSDDTDNTCEVKGLGAVAGVSRGKARIITHSRDLLDLQEGEIIVCESLAPSWLSSFKKAAGVVAQIGGIMSHTAIICREYQIPCVVAVPQAVSKIYQGANLHLDGEKGIVRIENLA